MLPTKIISGGQTGADQAALEFAIAAGIDRGGWCPKGGRCEGGTLSAAVMQRYGLRETSAWGYEERTRFNVRDSDATLILNRSSILSPGCSLTAKICRDLGKRFQVLRLPVEWFACVPDQNAVNATGREVAAFLAATQPVTLNVAGNREGTTPGIGAIVRAILSAAWSEYRIGAFQTDPSCNPEKEGVVRDGNGRLAAVKGAWGWHPAKGDAVPLPDKPQKQAQMDFSLDTTNNVVVRAPAR